MLEVFSHSLQSMFSPWISQLQAALPPAPAECPAASEFSAFTHTIAFVCASPPSPLVLLASLCLLENSGLITYRISLGCELLEGHDL